MKYYFRAEVCGDAALFAAISGIHVDIYVLDPKLGARNGLCEMETDLSMEQIRKYFGFIQDSHIAQQTLTTKKDKMTRRIGRDIRRNDVLNNIDEGWCERMIDLAIKSGVAKYLYMTRENYYNRPEYFNYLISPGVPPIVLLDDFYEKVFVEQMDIHVNSELGSIPEGLLTEMAAYGAVYDAEKEFFAIDANAYDYKIIEKIFSKYDVPWG